MNKVILQGCIEVPHEDLPSVIEALPTHIALSNQELDCLIFSIKQRENAASAIRHCKIVGLCE